MIGSTLTEEGRNKLCNLLQRNLDIFAWKPADMTGIPRHIVEHRLNMREGCSSVRQKKRGQAADRNQAIQEEKVESLCGFPFKCFLDAYKGYHQIQMAKEDEEKIAFITSQGILCYTKMPFGLRNAGETYQRLVDKAFHKQIGRNLEVYLDDLVIKSCTEDEIVRDIEETFKTLREINMKLNPKKCTFGVEEGIFLGYKVNTKGLKVCLDKVDDVLSLPSPKCLKDVQKLNGKLASLNRFLAISTEKSLPFFKTLKKCTKKSDFHWTAEAEEAFRQMKQLIAELPMLIAPMEKEELIVYSTAAKETVSAVLMIGREAKQTPIYFVSKALRGPELNYTSMEKLVLALTESSRKVIEMEYRIGRIRNTLQTLVKGQILADFIVERPEEDSPDTLMEMEEELPEPWILFTDGASCTDGSGAGLVLTNPEGMEFTYALRFRFDATNNEAEYEALITGLRIAEQMGVKNLQENVKTLTSSFKAFSIRQAPRSENIKAYALSKIASTSFAHLSNQVLVEELKEKSISGAEILAVVKEEGDTWITPVFEYLMKETLPVDEKKARAGIDIAGPFPEGPGKVKFLIVAIDYFTKWIEAKPVATITDNQVKTFVWDNIVYRFGLLGEIISDNGKQFQDNPFKYWCENLCIRQHFAYVKHPQTNGLVERANHSLGEGIKVRLGAKNKNWLGEISHVLWAHRTMIKSSNGETLFSLTYGTEAVIPAEIDMPTLRTAEMDLVQNNEALEINLVLLEEKREQAAIREAKSKAKMEKYYNSKFRGTSFKPGDLVYRNNDASRAEDSGKLGHKWEGPYEATKELGKGAYKLRDRDGNNFADLEYQ
ncbi:reverse transcriptase domain-containing protein [Tanacetum coccineum]|uniref:Reverse transcriptase domain-containing protein n=1 Tax=Tanacetum coccineum TaxID=301880 RepID=A0ABQ5DEC3_9ASTR